MNSKPYRLQEFIKPADGRSLITDTSAGLSLGALPGLERFESAITPVLKLVDGVVTSPGQARYLSERTRQDAALIVRADWTNALRGSDFVLPPEEISHITLLDASKALDLGASALVLYFLLGHEETIEAGCLKTTVQLAIQGSHTGMPLILDIQPIGKRVVLPSKAIELGVSYALEGGADGIAIPWPGSDSFKAIQTMAAGVPIWIKPSTLDKVKTELGEALNMGATGLWLDEKVFGRPDTYKRLEAVSLQIHQQLPSHQD